MNLARRFDEPKESGTSGKVLPWAVFPRLNPAVCLEKLSTATPKLARFGTEQL